MHCVNTALYDTTGELVYTNHEVPAGDYLFELTRKFTNNPEYDDSKGVFYSLSADYALESIQLDKAYTVPIRTRDLYRLNVPVDKTYIATTNESNIDIYDANLSLIDSHVTVFALEAGTYYILTSNYACYSKNGSFDISEY